MFFSFSNTCAFYFYIILDLNLAALKIGSKRTATVRRVLEALSQEGTESDPKDLRICFLFLHLRRMKRNRLQTVFVY